MHPKLAKPIGIAGVALLSAVPVSVAAASHVTAPARPASGRAHLATTPLRRRTRHHQGDASSHRRRTTTEVSVSGDPSTGATTGTLTATVISRTGAGASRAVSPAAGSVRFLVSSLDGNDSGGTLQLVTRSRGQRSCSVRFDQVYVEQEDPSAMGAPDGWRGELSGTGDCTASLLPASSGTGASAGVAAGAGTGATDVTPSQAFLGGIDVTADSTGAAPSSSAQLSVPFVGTATTATAIVLATAAPACSAATCLLVDAASPSYVGEVIAGTLQVRAGGGGACSGGTLYDGPLPGVAARAPATVTVPSGCSEVTAQYAPPASPAAGEGGEPLDYGASAATLAVSGDTPLELAAGATYTYPPAQP